MVDILCRSTTNFSGTSMRVYYLPETSLDDGCKLFPPIYPCIKTIMTYLCIHKVGYKGHSTWHHVYTYGDLWWDHCKSVYHMFIYSSMSQAYRHSIYWRLCKQKKHWFDGCCNNVQASLLYIVTSKKFGECGKLHWVSKHGGTLYRWL
jgi:hypothetical protein